MNIQQALNQSLLSLAGSAYMTNHILEQGKQSAIDKQQKVGTEEIESARQENITRALQRDIVEEDVKKHAKELGLDKMTQEERQQYIDKRVENDPKVMSAKERVNLAKINYQRAERNLKKWGLDNDEVVNSYRKKLFADAWDVLTNEDDYVEKARLESKALRSLSQHQETYVSQEDAMKERPNIINNRIYHSQNNPNPSIGMEVK